MLLPAAASYKVLWIVVLCLVGSRIALLASFSFVNDTTLRILRKIFSSVLRRFASSRSLDCENLVSRIHCLPARVRIVALLEQQRANSHNKRIVIRINNNSNIATVLQPINNTSKRLTKVEHSTVQYTMKSSSSHNHPPLMCRFVRPLHVLFLALLVLSSKYTPADASYVISVPNGEEECFSIRVGVKSTIR